MMSSCNECLDKSFISLVLISDQSQKSVEAKIRKTGFLKKKLEFWPDFIWENLAKIPTFFLKIPFFEKLPLPIFDLGQKLLQVK